MTDRKPTRKPAQAGAPGVKQLISATALAATLTGWALLTATQPAEQATPVDQVVATVAAPQVSLPPPLLPTLLPVATAAPLNLPTTGSVVERPQVVEQAAAAPVATAAPAPPLRQVVVPTTAAPPAPVARTRASR